MPKRKEPDSWADEATPSPEKKQKPKKTSNKDEEKRMRRFRPSAPQSFSVVYERATSQRFYVLKRLRRGTAQCPEESVEMTGSTGNIYNIVIARIPTCDCPHYQKGNQCKHIIYVMARVLRARFELVYQLALLSTELQEIFANAPPIDPIASADDSDKDGKRKPIEDDCPICFTPFEGEEDTVYCRATCGQNIHKECFEMWAATKRKTVRDPVTCPMCRTPWQEDEDAKTGIKNTGVLGRDGYVNVADQLGISQRRDTSSYYGGPTRYGQDNWRYRRTWGRG